MLFAFLILIVSSCKEKPAPVVQEINPGFAAYVSGHTSGMISGLDKIQVRLSSSFTQEVTPGQEIKEKLFSISPSVKGTTVWADNRTLEFIPEERLEAGTEYQVQLQLDKLIPVEDEFRLFPFSFQTPVKAFQVRKLELSPEVAANASVYRLKGMVLTTDVITDEEIEEAVKARLDGQLIELEWTHAAREKKHTFVISPIERQEEARELIVSWDGSSMDADVKGKESVEIPSLSDFSLLLAKVVQMPEQYVSLRFSDPILPGQNLDGLVTIGNTNRLGFDIEDNEIRVFAPFQFSGRHEVRIMPGIQNRAGYKLKKKESIELLFDALKPAVRALGSGVIVPGSNGLMFPFEAVNLRAVNVRIVKIYEDNIPQFLQNNALDGKYEIRRVGRPLQTRRIDLQTASLNDLGQWNAFTLDLSQLVQVEPGVIYQVQLGFTREYSLYPCAEEEADENSLPQEALAKDELSSWWDDPDDWRDPDYLYYHYYYDWRQRDNPCHPAYYSPDKWVNKNVLASNLGIIAKAGSDGRMTVAVTDLLTTKPLSGVKVELLDFQQQLLTEGSTNGNGLLELEYGRKPFLLMATQGDQKGYLKLLDGESISMSTFDVSGMQVRKGIKGMLYGDRDVWRPGDSIYLAFILEDKKESLPPGHPVVLELTNPMGQVVERVTRNLGEMHILPFRLKTTADAPTGNWNARLRIGNVDFSKRLRIETIKPNRLKVVIDAGDGMLVAGQRKELKLTAKWLHGAVAADLAAVVEMNFRQNPSYFAQKHPGYVFHNPTVGFYPDMKVLFDGQVDDQGEAWFPVNLPASQTMPGMLKGILTSRVFEKGGDFSINQQSIDFAPYQIFTGLHTPYPSETKRSLEAGKDYTFEVATVDPQGKPVDVRGLQVRIFKMGWRWWWDSSGENLASYAGRTDHTPVYNKRINTREGKGSFDFKLDYPEWGRYLVLVSDPGGHVTGEVVYFNWPSNRKRSIKDMPGGPGVLSFTTDKAVYQTGEEVTVSFPSAEGGRALVSLENGSRVVSTHWVETEADETVFRFQATAEMAPNIYVHISMLQPHAQTANDLPIRMYGVMPVLVEDPETKLYPVIAMPDELRSETPFTLEVSEQNRKAMDYTIAVVDEGLLDLTNFRTPAPWRYFYAREALGVKTWDLYDDVLGAYGGRLEQLFAIGGGMEETLKEGETEANRFKPVVRYYGPFHLKAGKMASHEILLPQYIGSVRAMIVAAGEGAYGHAEKAVPVKDPLMILATLPRVLGPDEQVHLPVSVFVMDEDIQNVKVSLTVNDILEVDGESSLSLNTAETGEYDAGFVLKTKARTGVAKVHVLAEGGGETAEYDIELNVRNPNPPVTQSETFMLEAGESEEITYAPFGVEGTHTFSLEMASIPPINLERRLEWLVRYPHGCVEQTTSAVFPQLYLEDLMALSKDKQAEIEENIKAAVDKLKSFIRADGGFSYWPGGSYSNDWGSSYAGHFLLEAGKKGYHIPAGFKKSWIRYQQSAANNWRPEANRYTSNGMTQAYRLYTLALAGKPALGPMNRLREHPDLNLQAKWRLAAAYVLAGQPEAAEEMVDVRNMTIEEYRELSYSYGSAWRDRAMMLETLTALDKRDEGFDLLRSIAGQLNSQSWMSTQTTAFCLKAVAGFVGSDEVTTDVLEYKYAMDGEKAESFSLDHPLSVHEIADAETPHSFTVENSSKGVLFVTRTAIGVPLAGDDVKEESGLQMRVVYTNARGRTIDPANLQQGEDLKVRVYVRNLNPTDGLQELALSQIFPSGWEIRNTRLFEGAAAGAGSTARYQDIRDDRVYTYFDLRAGEQKMFEVNLNAAYAGEYYLPTVYCEAMYDNRIYARIPGGKVVVSKK